MFDVAVGIWKTSLSVLHERSTDSLQVTAVADEGFTFPLLSDVSLEVSVAYGAAADTSAGNADRIAVLVGQDGLVKRVWSQVDARKFPQTCLDEMK